MTSSELGKAETARVVEILRRILELELAGLVRYLHYSFMIFGHNRIPIVAGRNILLEEFARAQVAAEEAHAAEIGKMLRKPGSIA